MQEHTLSLTSSHLGQVGLAEVWKVKAHVVGEDEAVGPVAARRRPQHRANLVQLVNLGRSWMERKRRVKIRSSLSLIQYLSGTSYLAKWSH